MTYLWRAVDAFAERIREGTAATLTEARDALRHAIDQMASAEHFNYRYDGLWERVRHLQDGSPVSQQEITITIKEKEEE